MNKPATSRKRASVKLEATEKPKPKPRTTRKTVKKALPKAPVGSFKHRLLMISLEASGLAITAVSAIMILLGYSASWFSGTRFFSSLLPFAIGVLGLIVAAAMLRLCC